MTSRPISPQRRSYLKTVAAGACSSATALAGVWWSADRAMGRAPLGQMLPWILLGLACAAAALTSLLVVTGGILAERRDTLESAGRPYARPGERRAPGPGLLVALLRALRFDRLTAADALLLRPGDEVEILAEAEIRAGLDESGCLDGLRFMPEMAAYGGRRATVERRVDKLHDWVHDTGFRRVRETVQLAGLRCDGTSHGGCQANCHIRWKHAWLRRVPPRPGARAPAAASTGSLGRGPDASDATRYECQATELSRSGELAGTADPRHWLRPLLYGNVGVKSCLAGVALALFNAVQRRRQGAPYPFVVPRSARPTPERPLGLQPGDRVRVRPRAEIEATLDHGYRNRGLWFDGEMLRYCGGEYVVRARVQRTIVEATGSLRRLSSPCIVLEDVLATGELRAFNPENEWIFWREIWLERLVPAPLTDQPRV